MSHRFSRHLPAAVALVALLVHGVASSRDHDFPDFSFSGFGTLGVVHSDDGRADFTAGGPKPNGAGRHHPWSAEVDSLIGGQVTASLTSDWSAVVQIIVEQNYDDRYKPQVEWANVRYEITPDFSVRIGRIALPTFFVSDYRKVGYANPWVRPPVEMYSLVPFTSSDGIDASYRVRLGEVSNVVHALYGANSSKIPGNQHTEARNVRGLSNTMEIGSATLRISYQEGDATLPEINEFFDLFRQFGPSGAELADRYNVDDKPLSFLGAGASYDPGPWFLTGEWGQRRSPSFIGKQTAWYASAGYRVRQFTPYVVYSRSRRGGVTYDPGIASIFAAPLNDELNRSFLRSNDQETVSLGTRWDFAKDVALKLQFDRIYLGSGSAGTFRNEQADFELGGTVNVFSAAINLVF